MHAAASTVAKPATSAVRRSAPLSGRVHANLGSSGGTTTLPGSDRSSLRGRDLGRVLVHERHDLDDPVDGRLRERPEHRQADHARGDAAR